MKTLNSSTVRCSLVILAALIITAATSGSIRHQTSKKIISGKTADRKAIHSVTSAHILRNTPGFMKVHTGSQERGKDQALQNGNKIERFRTYISPEEMAEERAAFAPSEKYRVQAQSLYQTGDLSGAEAACLNALNSPPILHGQPQQVPFAAYLLGRIYLRGGHYEKAVYWLQEAKSHTIASGLNLNLALAYVKLGDYENASRFYSDDATLQYHFAGKDVIPQDLPGTDTSNTLQASILLARGLDAYLEDRRDDALVDFQAANRLAPSNALVAYYCADILSEKGRFAEAAPLYARAATGRALIAEEANRHLEGIKAWAMAAKRAAQ